MFLRQVADAQAAMFGQCCFDVGDVKCTLGTASFININTGGYAHASVAGKDLVNNCFSFPNTDSFSFPNTDIPKLPCV